MKSLKIIKENKSHKGKKTKKIQIPLRKSSINPPINNDNENPDEIIIGILSKGSKFIDSLKNENLENMDIKEKSKLLENLFDHLVLENEHREAKYNKLLELHRKLIESKDKESNSSKQLVEVMNENNKHKKKKKE